MNTGIISWTAVVGQAIIKRGLSETGYAAVQSRFDFLKKQKKNSKVMRVQEEVRARALIQQYVATNGIDERMIISQLRPTHTRGQNQP